MDKSKELLNIYVNYYPSFWDSSGLHDKFPILVLIFCHKCDINTTSYTIISRIWDCPPPNQGKESLINVEMGQHPEKIAEFCS